MLSYLEFLKHFSRGSNSPHYLSDYKIAEWVSRNFLIGRICGKLSLVLHDYESFATNLFICMKVCARGRFL